MKNIILILGFVWGASSDAALETKNKFNSQISVGRAHTCVLDDEGVKCWGYYGYFSVDKIDVPQLIKPVQVVSGFEHTCVLDDEGVKCWGSNESGQIDVPKNLKNAIQVSAGAYRTCALDDEGVKCWGYNGDPPDMVSPQPYVPQLINPVQVDAEAGHTCALDDEGVKCWEVPNFMYSSQVSGHSFVGAVQFNSGYTHKCAIFQDGDVSCEGEYYSDGTIKPTYLKNAVQIVAAGDHTCVMNDEGVKCWGRNQYGQIDVPKDLKNPREVSVGSYRTCALDDEGVKCWGEDFYHEEIDVPVLKYFIMSSVTAYLTLPKSNFLIKVEKFHKISSLTALGASEQLLIDSIISPLILGTDSDYFKKSVIPMFSNRMRKLRHQINLPDNQSPLLEIEARLENRKIALTAIQSSLDVSLSFLSGKQIDRAQDALRKVGQAMIDPMNDQNIIEAVMSVEALKEEREVLLSSEKSKFLIECQQVAIDWLKLKVK